MAKRNVVIFGVAVITLAIACGSDPGADIGNGGAPPNDGNPGGTAGPTPGAEGTPAPGTPTSPPLSECSAQRVVHLVGGIGGLAWFTLVWPIPEVITGNQATYSYDDPTKATSVGSAAHPLYARKDATTGAALWDKSGAHPQPTVFVAGINQAHTYAPVTTQLSGTDIVAAGAVAQRGLSPALPVLAFGAATTSLAYGPATGAPPVVAVDSIDAAIAELRKVTAVSAALEADLRPSATTIGAWVPAASAADVTALAQQLLFSANLFRHGLVGTVLIPALPDDPHGAFANAGVATARADTLTKILAGFYETLGPANETSCGHAGKSLSLADNTMLLVSGDTPKDSFDSTGWSDGTTKNSNVLYVRANGWLQPGWFGSISQTTKTEFDPTTGALAPTGTAAASQTAALEGILYAIARGNASAVTAVSTASFTGLVATP